MIKREELTNPKSCMSRAGDHEMTFVLLGRDAAAPAAIRAWIDERVALGKNMPSDEQILEAQHCADYMEQQRIDRIGLSTTKAEGGIPADGLGVAREVKATIALDGDTRRCCNNPDCDNDWPCALHPEHPQPSVQGPSDAARKETPWSLSEKYLGYEERINEQGYLETRVLRQNNLAVRVATYRHDGICSGDRRKPAGTKGVGCVCKMCEKCGYIPCECPLLGQDEIEFLNYLQKSRANSPSPSITKGRIAEIVEGILQPITDYDVIHAIEKALREAGVRVGE